MTENKYKRTKRCKWEIVHAMLKAVDEHTGANKTLIQHMAYIDWRSYKRYLNLVLNKGYISICTDCPDKNERYEITDKGKDLLEQLNRLDLKI